MKNKFIKVIKCNPLTKIIYNTLFNYPTPMSISYWWNFGSLLGICLIIQIISGLLLSIHYCPNIDLAFNSINHIMNDVNYGWFIRFMHMNGASFYFICMYLHIGRNIYYHSFNLTQTWLIGVMIFLLSMGTAFLGYVLPWGQMSYWGATVITNLVSAIPYMGGLVVEWVWGGFSINNATLNRFYSLHFLLPLLIFMMVILHLFYLHNSGSNNPMGYSSMYYKIPFSPYFIYKDLMGMIIMINLLIIIIMQNPYYLSDPDNFILANPMSTPQHIKPEWYFLFAYTILRTIPNKLGGVIGLLMSILILMILPFLNINNIKSNKFYPINNLLFWMLFTSFTMLTWLGAQHIEYPFFDMSIIFTLSYFSFFTLMSLFNKLWDLIIY